MAAPTMASAIEMPDVEPAQSNAPPANANKKRPADEDADLQENKRPKTSPGKDTPANPSSIPASQDQQESSQSQVKKDAPPTSKTEKHRGQASGPPRNKHTAEDKARANRLFGGLFAAAKSPRDKTTTKRQEIESRKKAELQKQDAARLEVDQKRLERLRGTRQQRQVDVDKEKIRVRQDAALNQARFLKTRAKPELFYRPYILSEREEDQIDDQIDAVRDRVYEERKRAGAASSSSRPASPSSKQNGPSSATPKGNKDAPDAKDADAEISAAEKAQATDATEPKKGDPAEDGHAQASAQDKPDVDMSSDKEQESAAATPGEQNSAPAVQDPSPAKEPEPKPEAEPEQKTARSADADEEGHVVDEGDKDTVSS